MSIMAKAARMHAINEPLRVEEISTKAPKPTDAVVKVMAAGICSSDIHFIRGHLPVPALPIVPGHECAGVVESVGKAVTSLVEGDHVVVDYVEPCGSCRFCLDGRENLCDSPGLFGFSTDGAFQQFVTVPARNLHRVPKKVALDQSALLGCAVVTPYHALGVADVASDETVVIFGIGGVGLHAVLLSKERRCRIIAIDLSEDRLRAASEAGADVLINASSKDPVKEILKATSENGADHCFDFIGSALVVDQCVKAVRKGGNVVLVGIWPGTFSMKPLDLLLREVNVITSLDHVAAELEQVIQLVASGKIDLSRSVTHHVPLDKVNEGIRILEERLGNPTRIVVLPHQSE